MAIVQPVEPEVSETREWYRTAGLSIVSSIPLDEMCARSTPGRPDLIVERMGEGPADEFATGTAHLFDVGEIGSPWMEVRRGPGGYLTRWPGQLDVVIPNDGSRLMVCERGPVEDSIARLILCQALSFALPSHGREGVHAAAVEIEGHAVVLMGESGRGKSTLATALCARGARLLADDVSVLRVSDEGLVVVDPTTHRTWLAHEVAAEMTGSNGSHSPRVHKVPVDAQNPGQDPYPVGAVFVVRYQNGAPLLGDPLGKLDAFRAILSNMFNLVVRTPERARRQFQIATQIADQVPIREIRWEPGPSVADAVAECVIDAVKAGVGGSQMNDIAGVEQQPTPSERARVLQMLRAAGVDDLPTATGEEPLLRTSQVAALLRSSDRTVRTWADAGKLRYIKTLGGRRLFPVSGVMQVLHEMHKHSTEES